MNTEAPQGPITEKEVSQMHKKIIMACMAIAAFAAFVVAPAASASPVLTHGATTVPVGTKLTATNTGITKFTASTGTVVECSSAWFTGTLTQNNGTSIKGEIPAGSSHFTGTSTENDCTSGLGPVKPTVNSKLCLETIAGKDEVNVTGCGGNVTFTLHITNVNLKCEYTVASVKGKYITNAAATVNVVEENAVLEAGTNVFCPASGKLDMDFDLYTDVENDLANPLTIS